ncbi:MAG: alkaline phosphatase family protein [Candidatus Palauibacterales bacterium]|nr:alkaline phosphatase family protein [Candidatus Palauibacterales bacterium]MDP2529168.1 alkaline phosphatase family protein [Candidatus Palauibacterales bacterium]MDP2583964.1 alkaline phosphatase family protein [Candidatus Palauibacterales bacterium]
MGPGLVAGVLALAITGCGRATTPIGPAPLPNAGRFDHVILVVEENHGYGDVIGDSAMPYLNSLADSFGLATRYFADTHPSIGNYFMLATGQVVTNDDGYATVVDVDNVARRLVASGRTWKSYAEDLPSVGYVGGDTGGYARKHNVLALLSDVVHDSVQRANLVPFNRFAQDLAAGTLPDFANIVPNLCHDGHDCSLAVADAWLRDHIGPLLASPTFQADGMLIIAFDEAPGSDTAHGGGRVPWVVVSPRARRGFRSDTLFQHASTLRLVLESLGVDRWPGAAADAPSMDAFFTP